VVTDNYYDTADSLVKVKVNLFYLVEETTYPIIVNEQVPVSRGVLLELDPPFIRPVLLRLCLFQVPVCLLRRVRVLLQPFDGNDVGLDL